MRKKVKSVFRPWIDLLYFFKVTQKKFIYRYGGGIGIGALYLNAYSKKILPCIHEVYYINAYSSLMGQAHVRINELIWKLKQPRITLRSYSYEIWSETQYIILALYNITQCLIVIHTQRKWLGICLEYNYTINQSIRTSSYLEYTWDGIHPMYEVY